MKTILIPTEDHDAMPAVLEAARLIARSFDSYMEGFAVRPSLGTYVTVEPVSSLAISGAYEADIAPQARAQFEAFMQAHAVPQAVAGQGPAAFSWAWPFAEAADDSFIGDRGRVFDLIALGRPGSEAQNPRMAPLEEALFESGRPVLIVPPNVPKTIGRNVLVAWNRSTEQAHTNAFALPILRLADKVTVLTVEGGSTVGPSGEEAALHLRRNGVKATALTVNPGDRTGGQASGEITLEHAGSLGCDLLVKSAYTQSRLRQMIFGGATRHVLANATLPILMAH
jgi:nucleotide-binding universal stress UspA family protein